MLKKIFKCLFFIGFVVNPGDTVRDFSDFLRIERKTNQGSFLIIKNGDSFNLPTVRTTRLEGWETVKCFMFLLGAYNVSMQFIPSVLDKPAVQKFERTYKKYGYGLYQVNYNSSGPGKFQIEFKCTIKDPAGNILVEGSVYGVYPGTILTPRIYRKNKSGYYEPLKTKEKFELIEEGDGILDGKENLKCLNNGPTIAKMIIKPYLKSKPFLQILHIDSRQLSDAGEFEVTYNSSGSGSYTIGFQCIIYGVAGEILELGEGYGEADIKLKYPHLYLLNDDYSFLKKLENDDSFRIIKSGSEDLLFNCKSNVGDTKMSSTFVTGSGPVEVKSMQSGIYSVSYEPDSEKFNLEITCSLKNHIPHARTLTVYAKSIASITEVQSVITILAALVTFGWQTIYYLQFTSFLI